MLWFWGGELSGSGVLSTDLLDPIYLIFIVNDLVNDKVLPLSPVCRWIKCSIAGLINSPVFLSIKISYPSIIRSNTKPRKELFEYQEILLAKMVQRDKTWTEIGQHRTALFRTHTAVNEEELFHKGRGKAKEAGAEARGVWTRTQD